MARSGSQILDQLWTYAKSYGLINFRFDEGRLGMIFSVVSAEIAELEGILELYVSQFNLETATNPLAIEYLTRPFISKRVASSAKVILRFQRGDGYRGDILLPAGLTIQSAGPSPISYQLMSDAIIYSGVEAVSAAAFSVKRGEKYMVSPNFLTIIRDTIYDNRGNIVSVNVTNPESSWGGRDDETFQQMVDRAKNFRYTNTTGNLYSVRGKLEELGVNYHEYNIMEYPDGYGTCAIILDIENADFVEEIKHEMDYVRAAGVMFLYSNAQSVYGDFLVDVTVSSKEDLVPFERNTLMRQIELSVRNLIKYSGVGKDISLKLYTTQLYRELINIYNISDITLYAPNLEDRTLGDNIIFCADTEVIKIGSIRIRTRVRNDD